MCKNFGWFILLLMCSNIFCLWNRCNLGHWASLKIKVYIKILESGPNCKWLCHNWIFGINYLSHPKLTVEEAFDVAANISDYSMKNRQANNGRLNFPNFTVKQIETCILFQCTSINSGLFCHLLKIIKRITGQ